MPKLAGNKQFFCQCLFQRTRLSSFWQKVDGPHPVELDMKVLIPAPIFCLQAECCIPQIIYFSLNRKIKRPLKKNSKYGKVKMMAKIKHSWNFLHISSFFHSVVLVFRNEGNLVALVVDTSFRRVATSMLQRISGLTTSGSHARQAVLKWGVNTERLQIRYSIAAQHTDTIDCDVTRLVMTERTQNKKSLLGYFAL